MMTIKEIADLTGVSIRTLQYYDKINLLTPTAMSPSGYRLYNAGNLFRIYQIIFYKELGFSLKEILQLLNDFSSDPRQKLSEQKEVLKKKKLHIERMIFQINYLLKDVKSVDLSAYKKSLIKSLHNRLTDADCKKVLALINSDSFEESGKDWDTYNFFSYFKKVDDLKKEKKV